jgi:hypothetical protein
MRLLLAGPALAFVLVATACSSETRGGSTVRDLPGPSQEIEEPYSLVTSVREAGQGLVVVVDGLDGDVSSVNFASGERNPVGRQGSGPGEYRAPGAVFRVHGDTIWVLDAAQQRITTFLPDLSAGIPFRMPLFDAESMTASMAPFHTDDAGLVYSNALPVSGGQGMQIPDSVEVVRFDPRADGERAVLAKLRFPTSGTPEMHVEGTVIKYKMEFPGLVTADSWAVFPDGRLAIVHGADYSVEFVSASGERSAPHPIDYERIPVSQADQDAEMAEARRQLAEQSKAAQRTLPAGVSIEIDMPPPETWPSEYPAISPLQAFAAPDGMLWVRRAVPVRLDRERWDVIDPNGTLVARWQLPVRTKLVGVGAGVAYTVRLDDDDLQHLQRVQLGG